MDKLEIKKGNSVKFADLIDDGKKMIIPFIM